MEKPAYEDLDLNLKKVLNPENKKGLNMIAKGVAPLPPQILVSAWCYLIGGSDAELSEASKASLKSFPEKNILPLVSQDLPAWVLFQLGMIFRENENILEPILLNGSTPNELFVAVAPTVSERLTQIIVDNQERLIEVPELVRALEKNKNNLKSNTDRLRQFLRLAGIFVPGDQIQEQPNDEKEETPPEEKAPEKLDDQEELTEERRMSLHQYIMTLNIGAKVKLAVKGNKEARGILIRDTNKVVSTSVLKSPKINENELVHFSGMHNVSEDVIRDIARNPMWTKSYAIKHNLINHPKAPLQYTMPFIKFLNLRDLTMAAKSRTMSGPLRKAAKELLAKKRK